METIIYFATDHAGFELKNDLLQFVRDELHYEVVDCGAYVFNKDDDFTDFISKAAREVSAEGGEGAKAIILGGSGQGEAMLANRFHDVRAVVYYGGNTEILMLSRAHNDANVLSLGARFLEKSEAKEAVKLWLSTPHENVEKYDRRIDEIESYSGGASPKLSIAPSLPAASHEALVSFLEDLKGTAREVQIDIVDGEFVPAQSWPFTGGAVEAELEKLSVYTPQFDIEIDCMCIDPEQYLDLFAQLGVKRVVIHMGSTNDYFSCIAHAKKHGYKIGFALTNDIPLEELGKYIDALDFVQVMGIKEVGSQGQAFDERTLRTVALLRKVHPYLEIAVDGAVNEHTIPHLKEAGVTRFAPGSAIAKATDRKAAYEHLKALIGL
jgi:ribose 5-phosphate isomerase B